MAISQQQLNIAGEEEPLNLLVFLDGTGDWAGSDCTNVLKLYQHAVKDDSQRAYYDGGIGTLNDPGQMTATGRFVMRTLDLALATGLGQRVLDAYTFLVREYQPGARIYLFGFSRGAFTARVLSSMIYEFGLLMPDNEHLAPYLWQTLSDVKMHSQFQATADKIRRDFSRPGIEVEFMGLFDTVSSVGVLSRFKTFPSSDGNQRIHHVRHAVASDEQRNLFPECLFDPAKCPDTLEVWFPGVHRDVGGGYLEKDSALPNVPLEWVAEEAVKFGLKLDLGAIRNIISKATPTPPKKPFSPDPYVIAGVYPMLMEDLRLEDQDPENPFEQYRQFWPNFKHERQKPTNAIVYDPKQWPLSAGSATPTAYTYAPGSANFQDCVGIVLGCGILFMLVDAIIHFRPFGMEFVATLQALPGLPSAPNLHSIVQRVLENNELNYELVQVRLIELLAVAFVISQAFPAKKTGPNSFVPVVGVVLIAIYLVFGSLATMILGMLTGLIVWAISQLRFPVLVSAQALTTVRVLPFAGTTWLGVAGFGGALPLLNRCLKSASPEWLEPWRALLMVACVLALILVGSVVPQKPVVIPADPRRTLVEETKILNRATRLRQIRRGKNRIRLVILLIALGAWAASMYFTYTPAKLVEWVWIAVAVSTIIPLAQIMADRKALT